jgi:hypothetical protein
MLTGRRLRTMIIMSEKTKPEQAALASSEPDEQIPDWLGGRLRRMFSEVMEEPVPDEFKALLKQLEEKERGS